MLDFQVKPVPQVPLVTQVQTVLVVQKDLQVKTVGPAGARVMSGPWGDDGEDGPADAPGTSGSNGPLGMIGAKGELGLQVEVGTRAGLGTMKIIVQYNTIAKI